MYLGARTQTGVQSPANRIMPGAWVVEFVSGKDFRSEDVEVWHAAFIGPGGYVRVYIDHDLFGVAENGKINEYTPSIPMYVKKGQRITLHWSTDATPAPVVTLWLRTPAVPIL